VLKLIPHALLLYAGTFSAVFLVFVTGGMTPCNAQNAGQNSFDQLSNTAQFSFDQWRTAEGLPDNTINDLLQTSDGYLWIATQGGLVRFDGYQFTLFNVSNTRAMKINAISTLVEGRDGTVWIGTSGGGILRYREGRFTSITTADGLPSNYISDVCGDGNGGIWAGSAGGGIAHLQGDSIEVFGVQDGLSNEFIKSVFLDSGGTLWVGTDGGGLDRFSGGRFRNYRTRHGLPSDYVQTVCQDTQGALWVGTSRGLAEYKNDRFVHRSNSNTTPHAFVLALLTDTDGGLWIGTNGNGLSRYDNGLVSSYTMKDGLANNFVTCMVQDTEGSLWIGTERGGLNRLRKTRMRTLTTRDGLPMDYVRSVYEDRAGTIWVGTNGGGIARWKHGAMTILGGAHGLPVEFVRPFLEDSKGVLWIGTWGGGMARYEHGVVSAAPGFEGKFVRAILEDRRGNLWVGTNGNGVTRFLNGVQTVLTTETGLSNNFVSSIVEDSTGAIWIGTSGGGVNVVRGDSLRIYDRKDGLSHDFVSGLYVDAEGTVWLSTNGGGLNCFRDGIFRSWTSVNDLPDDALFMILDDQEGNLWLPCPRGIIRVEKESLFRAEVGGVLKVRAQLFNEQDGMRSSECTSGSQNTVCRTRDGRLWFATVEGLVMIGPREARRDSLKLPVYIERFMVDKVSVDPTVVTERDFGNGELEFQYTAVSFRDAKQLRFRYKLEGFDQSWQEAGTRRTAYYTNVPPGRYTFRVAVASHEGISGSREASLPLTLHPPFWMTTWFRLLMGLAVLSLVALMVRFVSTRALQRRLRLLEAQHALERERMRISKDMHDELGASLTRITLLSELAKRDLSDPGAMRKHLEKLSDSTRETAATMDEIVWAVNPKNDTLDRMAAYILQHAQEFLSVAGLDCKFEVPDLLPDQSVSAEVRHNMFLAIKETLNNIVKHSNATAVRITLRYTPPELEIVVHDNGRGFTDRDVTLFSDGLGNMQKRMEDIQGKVCLVSAPGQGTSVSLTVNL